MVSANDQLMQGMFCVALDFGIGIPGELPIATHANTGLSQFLYPAILRLEVGVDQMAKLMLEKARDKIHGRGDEASAILPLIPALS